MCHGLYSRQATAHSTPSPTHRWGGKPKPYEALLAGAGQQHAEGISLEVEGPLGEAPHCQVNRKMYLEARKAQEPGWRLRTLFRKEVGDELEKRPRGAPGLPLVSDSGVKSDMSTRKSRYCWACMRSPGKSLSTEANCSILFFTDARTCHTRHLTMSVMHSGIPASASSASLRGSPRHRDF